MLIAVVVVGALLVASIAFVGSYTAVHHLAKAKGFGTFSIVFPIGIDCGILVVLALDVLLTWLRCPFPLLRYTAWLLTGATIAFNAALLWPDPLGTAMHATLPVIFTVSVEAARHAVGRLADITHARHIESVRLARWFLSPVPTFKLWRGMQLWNRRSYQTALEAEQARLVYIAKLRRRHGIWWRFKAPVEEILPLRLAAIGVPLPHASEPVEPMADLPAAPQRPHRSPASSRLPAMARSGHSAGRRLGDSEHPRLRVEAPLPESPSTSDHLPAQVPQVCDQGETPSLSTKVVVDAAPATPDAGVTSLISPPEAEPERAPRAEPEPEPKSEKGPEPEVLRSGGIIAGTGATRAEAIYAVFAGLTDRAGKYPSMPALSNVLFQEHGITGRKGRPMSAESLRRYRTEWMSRYERETAGVAS
ncbi:DUF2637 domain-containing protein [Streptomyces sp. S1D4-20]|uniref:DUF2637 domain-containing protein n=1 Tax=Streptomyces sp. S1D4-20 TaxID=2594462 RepID=UPI001F07369B|nr:DUF2637 domain-containing protein [Streptomyces sp. S1D4-20]